ncbi:metal-dependent hydrolase family protein [Arenicella xantha]|uniref:Imidazolonepropionase-like amidohydrolase n=1 Tax=Arenicella xantha TaxID=644221 RepID=A0A395JVQ3_9GAMM|nr:amidohydrolase family protein [Arenicella xantha]RBP53648.1 imidazolonepropionase-like amidohydrolase [Arenicella xantha]
MLPKAVLTAALSALLCVTHAQAATYLTADAMVDVIDGKLIANPVIVIDGDRIREFGSDLTIPADAETVINLSGMTLLPGLIDTHVHMTGSATEHGYKRLATSQTRAALRGAKNAARTLRAGVTTVRNLGAPGFIDVALRDAINDGDVLGPRMFVSGPSLGISGGHCDNNLLPVDFQVQSDGVADGPWEVAKKVRTNIKYGADLIKFCATGGVLSKGTKVGVQQYSLEEMQMIVQEAHRRGITVAAHAHGTEGIYAAIQAGVDSVEHASFIDDAGIQLAKQKGTYLSMDIYNTEYILGEGAKAGILEESLAKERKTGTLQRESFTRAVKAGIKMTMGTDAGVYPHGDNLKQLSRMVKFGMTPMQALQAASINPAKLLKREQDLGSLSAGRFADIIAVRGNPLEDISLLENVAFVMKGGAQIKE